MTPEQDETELQWLLSHMRGSESMLEIGSRQGASLAVFAKACISGAKIRSIEIEETPSLFDAVKRLHDAGYDADVLFADSASSRAKLWAAAHGPYDFIFIDGNHDHDGVRADWDNYGGLGRVVALHDIHHREHGVWQLWAEIKQQGLRTEELIASHMGTGIVFRNSA